MRPTLTRGLLALALCVSSLVAAAARVVPGAHWPSDVLGTYAICLSWLHAGLAFVLRPPR